MKVEIQDAEDKLTFPMLMGLNSDELTVYLVAVMHDNHGFNVTNLYTGLSFRYDNLDSFTPLSIGSIVTLTQ